MMAGSSTSKITVPEWQNRAAQDALAAANRVANIGYTPYYGPDVAALTPMQMAAMQGTNQAAQAFGMPTTDPMAGLPQATNYGGVQAYSSGGLYDQALAELKRRNPEQYTALTADIVPQPAPVAAAAVPTPVQGSGKKRNRPDRPSQAQRAAEKAKAAGGGGGGGGGFTSLRDMFDGGGAGRSGGSFSGGPLSGVLNSAGMKPIRGTPVARPPIGKGR
jgi:hypothetical protein